MSANDNSNAAAIIDAVERLAVSETIDISDVNKIAIVPRGMVVEPLKKYRDQVRAKPERIKGTATFTSLDSFIRHANIFRGPNSAVFASRTGITVIYDYHDKTSPEWCEHRAVYEFPISKEFCAWQTADARPMNQGAFAEFLEQRIADVTTPKDTDADHFGELNYTLASPASLLALSRGLQVRVEMDAVARPNLSSGETEVSYKETHSDGAGQPLKIPGGFMILVPPFENGVQYRIPVRLRYRVQGGKVIWSLHLHRADVALDEAREDACDKVSEQTQLPLFHGTPEEE